MLAEALVEPVQVKCACGIFPEWFELQKEEGGSGRFAGHHGRLTSPG